MEVREFLLAFALFSVSVSAQYGYGDRFAVDGFDNTVGGDSSGCPDFGPMESFNAEGLQRGKVRSFIFGAYCVIKL